MAETERNNLPVAEEPEFTTEIPAIRPDDPVHFAQMNAMLESLLGNDVFLKRLANKMIENSLIAHVLDCENPQMVLGADQGPVITGLIDEVKGDITQLYSDIGINLEDDLLFYPVSKAVGVGKDMGIVTYKESIFFDVSNDKIVCKKSGVYLILFEGIYLSSHNGEGGGYITMRAGKKSYNSSFGTSVAHSYPDFLCGSFIDIINENDELTLQSHIFSGNATIGHNADIASPTEGKVHIIKVSK